MTSSGRKPTIYTRWNKPIRIINFILFFIVVGLWYLVFTQASLIPGFYGSIEQDQANKINSTRSSYGLASLQHIECLNTVAENWSKTMALSQNLYHNSNRATQISDACGPSWTNIGENIAGGPDSATIFSAFMNSAGHKASILNSIYTKMGMGAYYDNNGKLWVTQLFARCNPCSTQWSVNATLPADPVVGTDILQLFLRNSNSSGGVNSWFTYGKAGDIALMCDWNGDRIDTIGVYRPSNTTFYLRNSNSGGAGEITFGYGSPGDKPLCGDWNGDGIDTIGIYRPSNGTFYLRNSNSSGNADLVAALGNPNEIPIVCDWNGDRIDTIGIRRGDSFYIQNTNSTSPGSVVRIIYGASTDEGICGDWNGDGIATIGVKRGNMYYLRNSNSSGTADITFGFGDNTDRPVVGDYNGDRVETVGVSR